ncbi:MAG: GNAT family N-acetyltransferase [Steroidobacteraceae bacterium]
MEDPPSAPPIPDPAEHARDWCTRDGRLTRLRDLRPDDLELELAFVDGLSPETRYLRLQYASAGMSRSLAERLLELDGRDRVAIAATSADGGGERIVGVCRYAREPSARSAEFAIVVADAWQGCGLGTELFRALCIAARHRGIHRLYGETLATNRRFIDWARSLGFEVTHATEADHVRVTLDLNGPKAPL